MRFSPVPVACFGRFGPRFWIGRGRKSNHTNFCFAVAASLIARTAGCVSLRSTEIA